MTQLHGMMTVARMRTTSASGSREAADARPGEEMRRPVRVSIIICTYNRAESLSRTLDALSAVQVPATLRAEVIVVDNGSTDATPAIVRSCRMLDGAAPHYISEPRRGQCFARNRGLAQAGGDVIIFIDDDVRPTPGWLAALCRPLVEGRADAVVGAMELGPELERPWMKAFHRVWLTSTEHLRADEPPPNMVGANMAFARRVLARVPQFDTDLGPGALGYHDDVLFSRQLAEAGFRIAFVPDALARHHFEPARTTRAGLIDMAE
ncbi:MAG: glycosyltransferase family 2 protein, partial [Tepidisphaeraceae bacterium]